VKNWTALPAAAAALVLLAGCASSTSTTTTSTGTSATSAPAGAGGYRGYGTSVAVSRTKTASTAATTVSVEHTKLGAILAAGPHMLSVYLFEADTGGKSACSGACATAWPPVTTGAAPVAGAGASAAALGTITRSDGTHQVTYAGHPLYYFVEDKAAGDVLGQGVTAFGAPWYVLQPSGSKLSS